MEYPRTPIGRIPWHFGAPHKVRMQFLKRLTAICDKYVEERFGPSERPSFWELVTQQGAKPLVGALMLIAAGCAVTLLKFRPPIWLTDILLVVGYASVLGVVVIVGVTGWLILRRLLDLKTYILELVNFDVADCKANLNFLARCALLEDRELAEFENEIRRRLNGYNMRMRGIRTSAIAGAAVVISLAASSATEVKAPTDAIGALAAMGKFLPTVPSNELLLIFAMVFSAASVVVLWQYIPRSFLQDLLDLVGLVRGRDPNDTDKPAEDDLHHIDEGDAPRLDVP
jgi:hypothetical protein